MPTRFKIVWWLLLAAFTVAGFFGVPLPKDWDSAKAWLTSIDNWIIHTARYPGLFALALGLVLGSVIIPEVWKLSRKLLSKRTEFKIEIYFLSGFRAPSTTVADFDCEWVNVLAGVTNVGHTPSIAKNWKLSLVDPQQNEFIGLPKHIDSDVHFQMQDGDVKLFPPKKALYRVSAAKPLAYSDRAVGVLQYEMDGMPGRAIDLKTALTISVEDAAGNTFSETIRLNQISERGRQLVEGLFDDTRTMPATKK
jgi:hypothetical protein